VNLSDHANNYRNYNANRDGVIKGMAVIFSDPRSRTKTTTEEPR
jgi:hypothetical protein